MGIFPTASDKGFGFTDRLKYVDDYRTEEVTDEKGRTRKKAVYIGPWIFIKGDKKVNRTKIIGTFALCVLACAGLILLQLPNYSGSGWLPVSIPKAVALFPMLYMMMGAFALPFKLDPMHRDRYYHSFIRISRSAVAVLAMTGVSFIAGFVFRIIESDWLFLKSEWLVIGAFAVEFALLAAILIILYSVDVEEKPNSEWHEEAK